MLTEQEKKKLEEMGIDPNKVIEMSIEELNITKAVVETK